MFISMGFGISKAIKNKIAHCFGIAAFLAGVYAANGTADAAVKVNLNHDPVYLTCNSAAGGLNNHSGNKESGQIISNADAILDNDAGKLIELAHDNETDAQINNSQEKSELEINKPINYNSLEHRLKQHVEHDEKFYEKYQERLNKFFIDRGDLKEDDKVIYLTYDDGPNSHTGKILDLLKKHNIQATFFVNGRSDENSFNKYRRIVNEGHTLGNHTYSHNYSNIYSSIKNFFKDFYKLEDLLKEVTGAETPRVFRFPGGSSNGVSISPGGRHMMHALEKELNVRGYKTFDWNENYSDARQQNNNPEITIPNTLSATKNNINRNGFSLNLFHDSNLAYEATKALIELAEKKGYEFRPLDKNSATVHHRYFQK